MLASIRSEGLLADKQGLHAASKPAWQPHHAHCKRVQRRRVMLGIASAANIHTGRAGGHVRCLVRVMANGRFNGRGHSMAKGAWPLGHRCDAVIWSRAVLAQQVASNGA